MMPGGLLPTDMVRTMSDDTRATLRVLGTLALHAADSGADPLPEDEHVNRSASRLLTIQETSSQLRLSRWSVYQLINQRRIASVKVGSRRLVPLSEVDRFVAQLVAEDEGRS